mmetsp:Transcript_62441/g.110105  ORF Transcript_62441/g.110105 Transcript_62441/m.110105 type:complete len:250 (-) Transcript_62441:251-1000(-)
MEVWFQQVAFRETRSIWCNILLHREVPASRNPHARTKMLVLWARAAMGLLAVEVEDTTEAVRWDGLEEEAVAPVTLCTMFLTRLPVPTLETATLCWSTHLTWLHHPPPRLLSSPCPAPPRSLACVPAALSCCPTSAQSAPQAPTLGLALRSACPVPLVPIPAPGRLLARSVLLVSSLSEVRPRQACVPQALCPLLVLRPVLCVLLVSTRTLVLQTACRALPPPKVCKGVQPFVALFAVSALRATRATCI